MLGARHASAPRIRRGSTTSCGPRSCATTATRGPSTSASATIVLQARGLRGASTDTARRRLCSTMAALSTSAVSTRTSTTRISASTTTSWSSHLTQRSRSTAIHATRFRPPIFTPRRSMASGSGSSAASATLTRVPSERHRYTRLDLHTIRDRAARIDRHVAGLDPQARHTSRRRLARRARRPRRARRVTRGEHRRVGAPPRDVALDAA